jgi:hypothetical protein
MDVANASHFYSAAMRVDRDRDRTWWWEGAEVSEKVLTILDSTVRVFELALPLLRMSSVSGFLLPYGVCQIIASEEDTFSIAPCRGVCRVHARAQSADLAMRDN